MRCSTMAGVAASGGYWIPATADEIWAAPTTLTGSIGIFGMVPTFEDSLAGMGLDGAGSQRPGRVERRAVTVGAARGDEVTISAGLSGGDKVVVEGSDNLADGVRVTEENR